MHSLTVDDTVLYHCHVTEEQLREEFGLVKCICKRRE